MQKARMRRSRCRQRTAELQGGNRIVGKINPDDIDETQSFCPQEVEKTCPDRDYCGKKHFRNLRNGLFCHRLKGYIKR